MRGSGKVLIMTKQSADLKTIGGRIRALRKEKALTQQELADLLYVGNKSKISRVENNKESLSAEQIQRLAEILETTADYLLGGLYADRNDPLLDEAVRLFQALKTDAGKQAALELLRQAVILERIAE